MQKEITIGTHRIGPGQPMYIIAEAGSNHDQDKDRAFKLIRECAKAGVDAVKFQLFKADKIAAKIDMPETRLYGQWAKFGSHLYYLYKDLELPETWLKELKACCQQEGVEFLATPFDEASADALFDLGVSAMKIASFEITHIPLLKHVGKMKIPVLISTGMANVEETQEAIDAVAASGEQRVALFHCGIQYPLPFEAVHLRAMETMMKRFPCPVGYSDHTDGWVVPVAVAALGGHLLEKHVTMEGGTSADHDFALTVEQFAEMVKAVRQCEQAMGSSVKQVQEVETAPFRRGRRRAREGRWR